MNQGFITPLTCFVKEVAWNEAIFNWQQKKKLARELLADLEALTVALRAESEAQWCNCLWVPVRTSANIAYGHFPNHTPTFHDHKITFNVYDYHETIHTITMSDLRSLIKWAVNLVVQSEY